MRGQFREIRVKKLFRLALLGGALLASAVSHGADPSDPTDYLAQLLAGMTASTEVCAARFPALGVSPQTWVDGMTPEDRASFEEARKWPEFEPALVKARARLAHLDVPADQIEAKCKALQSKVRPAAPAASAP